ncbi:MAG: adenylyl-sulfate kinase [Veillonellaceae bacterium]|nr:adenylyl-sulfate kinase [Veillonellaceae bacterium]
MTDGRVYWITGLSGAGKTTIGTALYKKLHAEKPNVVMLDGDKLREAYGGAFGYTEEERRKGALCNAKLSHLLASQGIDVICCTIGMYDSVRDWSRENNARYTEVYLNVRMDTLQKRDKKGLYSSHAKNLVGVDVKMEEPKHPDVVIHNDGERTVESIVEEICSVVQKQEAQA